MKKVVVAVDSFKGCLSSIEVANAVEAGIRSVFPFCEVLKLLVADGGEGTVNALVLATGGQIKEQEVCNPLMKPVKAYYGILGDGKTAVIEMATASGLTLLPVHERNPMLTTTYGTGQLIADALAQGCRSFILGIGGSATNDAGTGMLQALGYRFFDSHGNELGQGGRILSQIYRIDDSQKNPLLASAAFRVACDVNNPFSGQQGAAYVYAPQKGATPEMLVELDNGLKHFANLIHEYTGKDIASCAGAGAAGGMGGGLLAFLNAQLEHGIDLILDITHFDEQIAGADLIITGEGKMDAQTAMGKAPQGIANAAVNYKIPVIAIAGMVEEPELVNKAGIAGVFSITPRPMPMSVALQPAAATKHIKQTITQLCSLIKQFNK